MAWRIADRLIEGELNNTDPNRVTGWLRLVGIDGRVTLDLAGNFHRDIRGAAIRITGKWPEDAMDEIESDNGLEGFATRQTGDAGDITSGRPPTDYVDYGYVEWYSQQNGRVVIELRPEQIEVIGSPIPAIESDPIPREQQRQHMRRFLDELTDGINDSSDS